ncbi:MAG: phenylalanine--tRNA ligase subunit beta [Chloroflexi bacterium]|nr:phenylalanine--tRNA ligase subunit beta [Chloroflexota bacterium]
MRVPLSWLRDYVDVDLTPEQLAERLTLLGMEVKGLERWGAEWHNVVVGELLAVEPHPRADRLSLTRVTVGEGEPLEIVCGATNIAAGQRVPVALPGAVLPGGRRIERTEKMGVVSNGMLCSGDELRLTADADGILILSDTAQVGTALVELHGDVVLDVDVKPNRGDALSLIGLAREVAAATGARVRWPDTDPVERGRSVADRLAVRVEAPDLCSRFVARWVSGVRVAPSPDRVQMRLLAAGVRPVSNVVDASNYVMVELGKPIHTFDAAAIHPGVDGRPTIVVRRAASGEPLETLDHVHRTLDPDTLVIADPVAALGIAGIIGGASSEVGEATTDVVVESAVFDPVAIRRTGQRYGLRSEASLRFEKGQEVRLARIGADRTARLIAEWAGGTVAPGRVDTNPSEPDRSTVTFRPARVNRLLGTELSTDEQRALLSRLGLESESAEPDDRVTVALEPQPLVVRTGADEAVTALVPTWRGDIAIEADVAEEIARVRGYDVVPSILPHTPMPGWRPLPLEVRDAIRDTLAGAGLSEVVTHALVSPRLLDGFALRQPVPSVGGEDQPGGQGIEVTNPLSRDHSVLRQGLLGSLAEVIGTNRRHGREDVAIFEVGKGYAREGDETCEWWRLGIALTGPAESAAWNQAERHWDVDDAKGIVELLCQRLGYATPRYAADPDEPILHPGRSLRATATDPTGEVQLASVVGELHPDVIERWELRTDRVVVAELALAGLAGGQMQDVRSSPPPRHPPVERDLAVVVAEDREAASVADVIGESGGDLLRSASLFDIYRGAPLAGDEKSLAHRLVFAADRTLTEDEVDEAVARIARALRERLGARLRT